MTLNTKEIGCLILVIINRRVLDFLLYKKVLKKHHHLAIMLILTWSAIFVILNSDITMSMAIYCAFKIDERS